MTNLQVPDNLPDPDTLRKMALVAKVNKHMRSHGMHGIGGFIREDGTIFAQTTDGSELSDEFKALLHQSIHDYNGEANHTGDQTGWRMDHLPLPDEQTSVEDSTT